MITEYEESWEEFLKRIRKEAEQHKNQDKEKKDEKGN